MKEMSLKIFCDGGARGNPGPSAGAFVVLEGTRVIYKKSAYLGVGTNNLAEYKALILALFWLVKNFKSAVLEKTDFYLDSELVVRQLNGDFKVKHKNLKLIFLKAKSLEKEFGGTINYNYVSRTKNRLADFLVNKELDKEGGISR